MLMMFIQSWMNYSWELDWEPGGGGEWVFLFVLYDDDNFGNRRLPHLCIGEQKGGKKITSVIEKWLITGGVSMVLVCNVFIKCVVHNFCPLGTNFQLTGLNKCGVLGGTLSISWIVSTFTGMLRHALHSCIALVGGKGRG